MNEAFMSYIKNKSISLLGVGISNAPLVSKLIGWGAGKITVRDRKSKEDILQRFPFLASVDGVNFVCGDNYLDGIDDDIVMKTPGIRYDVPEIVKAKESGSEITSEIELFFRFCPAYKIAVTGSDGKSTTTTLIYEMLKAEGKKVILGGNIGEPLLYRINDIGADTTVVAELSSFQLLGQAQSPNRAVITNIAPNHLDWHIDFDEYCDAKSSIIKYQNKEGIACLNADNDNSKRYFSDVKGELYTFSRTKKPEKYGAWLEDDVIYFKDSAGMHRIMATEIIKIPGNHNIENYMAAICATWGLVSIDTIVAIAKNFAGVKYRLQFIKEKDGIKFYNSSIDSSPSRTNAALSSFKNKNVIIILGGKDKKVPFDSLAPELAAKSKLAVLTGAAMEKIYSDIAETEEFKAGKINFVREPDFEKAVRLAASNAQSGDIVLLSPACTSFDRFLNFEQRGEFFSDIVNSL